MCTGTCCLLVCLIPCMQDYGSESAPDCLQTLNKLGVEILRPIAKGRNIHIPRAVSKWTCVDCWRPRYVQWARCCSGSCGSLAGACSCQTSHMQQYRLVKASLCCSTGSWFLQDIKMAEAGGTCEDTSSEQQTVTHPGSNKEDGKQVCRLPATCKSARVI